MNMASKMQKLGLSSLRHNKKTPMGEMLKIAKLQTAQTRAARTLMRTRPLYGKLVLRNAVSKSAPVAQAEINQVEVKSEAQLKAERLAMHRKAVSMITGMWKDREDSPVDGVEYQNQMRDTW